MFWHIMTNRSCLIAYESKQPTNTADLTRILATSGIADSLEQDFGVHDVASLGVWARRGPVLWSNVHDDGSTDYPFVAANLTFGDCHRYPVMDMSTTPICLPASDRIATPESAE